MVFFRFQSHKLEIERLQKQRRNRRWMYKLFLTRIFMVVPGSHYRI